MGFGTPPPRLSPRKGEGSYSRRAWMAARNAVRAWPGRLAITALLLLAAVAPLRGAEELSGEALVAALRQGGHNIYFRHAATDWGQHDQVAAAGDWKSCDPARMRQLAPEGRATARRVGAALRALAIPVGRVLSSEYCRAAETARLLGVGAVETTLEIMNLRAADYVGGREAAIARARRQLAQPPAPGSNTVLVAHGNLCRDATGVYPGEAGAAIFRPQPDGTFAFVAALTPADWEALARRFGTGQ